MRSILIPFTIGLLALRVDACPTSNNDCLDEPPLPGPSQGGQLGGGLDGFESPYLGHTGSWDGKGGGLGGSSKIPDLDIEVSMGLRWTFMPVYWSKLEPDGPVDLTSGVPEAWQALDGFVIAAQARGLNILMQAPVMGGNAGAPPEWAGLREEGKSAPEDMAATASFAAKLTRRYRPGGTLATQQSWGETYGVRAWELDNEPSSYKTHWQGQAGDYAEFVTVVSEAIRSEDPEAVIVSPGIACCGSQTWLEQSLDAHGLAGSPTYTQNAIPHSIGPHTDVIGFHVYESLNNQTVDCTMQDRRQTIEAFESIDGFAYPTKVEYWHTEGNYDFFHGADETLRARWFPQMFTRAFTAGVRKVNVMDATPLERISVATYVSLLPNPFPMTRAEGDAQIAAGAASIFRHEDAHDGGRVWILWASGEADAEVLIPVAQPVVNVVNFDGVATETAANGGWVTVTLSGDAEIAEPVYVVDRP